MKRIRIGQAIDVLDHFLVTDDSVLEDLVQCLVVGLCHGKIPDFGDVSAVAAVAAVHIVLVPHAALMRCLHLLRKCVTIREVTDVIRKAIVANVDAEILVVLLDLVLDPLLMVPAVNAAITVTRRAAKAAVDPLVDAHLGNLLLVLHR